MMVAAALRVAPEGTPPIVTCVDVAVAAMTPFRLLCMTGLASVGGAPAASAGLPERDTQLAFAFRARCAILPR
jgi:hypothetical protein